MPTKLAPISPRPSALSLGRASPPVRRLEQLTSRRTGKEHWANVFRAFGLAERNGDLTALALARAQALKLRHRVRNGGSPG